MPVDCPKVDKLEARRPRSEPDWRMAGSLTSNAARLQRHDKLPELALHRQIASTSDPPTVREKRVQDSLGRRAAEEILDFRRR